MATDKRNCVICGESFFSLNHWTCSEACAEVLEDRKRANAAEEAELEVEEPVNATFEFGTSEAEKARQALSGLNDPPESGKALYRPELGLLELVQSAKVLTELCGLLVMVKSFHSPANLLAQELLMKCLESARRILDGHGPKVVRLADDVRADGEADDDEAAEVGAPDEGEDPGGHPEDGLGPDPVVVQGNLGDPVPGDGLDDGPAA